MQPENQAKAIIGLVVGLLLQLIGLIVFLTADTVGLLGSNPGDQQYGGVVFGLAGIAVFIWGCVNYVKAKGYSNWVGLIGLASLKRLKILFLPDPPKTNRRRYQFNLRYRFGLRTLFATVLVLSIGLGWFGSKVLPMRKEHNAVTQIERLGGRPFIERGWGRTQSGTPHETVRFPFTLERETRHFKTQFGNPADDLWLRRLLGFRTGHINDVRLAGTEVTNADLACLKHLPQLEILDLGNTQVSDSGMVHLQRLANLQILHLQGTQVTDDGLVHLRSLSNLKTIDLRGTQITDSGLVHLKELVELRRLNLATTKVTDQALKELQAALPHAVDLVMLKTATEIELAIAEIRKLGGYVSVPRIQQITPDGGRHLSLSKVFDAALKHAKKLPDITAVTLSSNLLTDADLPSLKGLTHLHSLQLNGTRVTDAGIEHLKGLTSLRNLSLNGTRVTDTGIEHLKGLTNLRSLHLQWTYVTGGGLADLKEALPDCRIWGRKDLQTFLTVTGDGGSTVDPNQDHKQAAEIRALGGRILSYYFAGEKVSRVTLPGSQFEAGLPHLKNMSSLRRLLFRGAVPPASALKQLPELTQLQELSFYDTTITDAELEHVKGMTNLRVLSLDYTRVTDAGLQHLRGLTNLASLKLARTRVTDDSLKHLKGLTSLQSVDLSSTTITDIGMGHLKGLSRLQTLNLAGTRVTDAGLDDLHGLTNLRYITIYNNSPRVTGEGIEKLRQALPKCRLND